MKKSQLAIQYIISFVLFLILVISFLLMTNNNMKRLLDFLDNKIKSQDVLYIRNLIFGSGGDPPFWNDSLENVKNLGYSIKPFILDYDKILFNDKIIRNLSKYDKFYDLFSRYITEPEIATLVKKDIKWIAYYKIKSINPLVFHSAEGLLKISNDKEKIKIEFNFSNYTNPYLLIELVTDKHLQINESKNLSINLISDYNFYLYKITTSNKTGMLILKYPYKNIGKEAIYYYPSLIIFKRLQCEPVSICENSYLVIGSLKVPLIKWFGMVYYKSILDKVTAEELVYNAILRTLFDNFVVETHLYVWE